MARLHIDFDRALGRVRPMHGVGQPPITGISNKMFHYLKEAGIPFSRLHDVGGRYGGRVYCDISCVFPDFSRDPADPDAYNFEFTDIVLAGLVENGVEPFFRLGETIENYFAVRRYVTFPPADYEKWARVCEGIIRHVNEGWANGHHFGIRYFEIWNEPDNDIPNRDNQMWSGTKEDYFRLYDVASKYLKARFPELQIGGYASCGFYVESNRLAGRDFTDRDQFFDDFFHAFLNYTRENHCPLDFFSWHSYASPLDTERMAHYCRRHLDEAGFAHVPMILNEWNTSMNYRGTARAAAETAEMFLRMHRAGLEACMYYDARFGVSIYGGMFNPLTAKPFSTYYSFVAFNALYRAGTEVVCEGDMPLVAMAARGENGERLALIVNTTDAETTLTLEGCPAPTRLSVIEDGEACLKWRPLSDAAHMPPHAVWLMEF